MVSLSSGTDEGCLSWYLCCSGENLAAILPPQVRMPGNAVKSQPSSCPAARSHQPHDNEHWEFDYEGYMRRRDASMNYYKIDESERRYRWER